VVSSARGQSADLSPYVNSVPPNYQRIAADLGAAPSQEAAEQALRHPSWWWSQNAYGGELAALAARAEPQPAAAAAGGSGGGGGESAGAGGGGGAAPAPNGSPASGATPASGAAPASGENATAPSDVDVRVDAAQAFNAYQNALRNLAAGRTAEAERGLRSAVELYHAFAEGWLALGHVQAERGAWAEAGRAYNHAATLRPDWPEAWFGMARAADAAPRPAEALTDYQRSLAAGLKGEAASFARERVAALGGK
jgi:tetratricopeptide (TPR) repeat protein